MASGAGNGRTRRQASRLTAAPPSRHEAAEQIHGLPAPIRIRWYRTRALAQEGRGRRPSCWTAVVSLAKPHSGWRQTVGNSRPDPEFALKAVEAATRQALAGLDGPWSARIAPLEAFCVEIASPSRLTRWQKAWIIVTEGLS